MLDAGVPTVAACLCLAVLAPACAEPEFRLPLCGKSADELIRAPVPGYGVEDVNGAPAQKGLLDGATAVAISAKTGHATTVGITRFAPEVVDYDAAFNGWRRAMLMRVGPPRTVGLAGLKLEVAAATESLPLDQKHVMWVRTHRDVAVLLMAATEEDGIHLAAEYVRAWGAWPRGG